MSNCLCDVAPSIVNVDCIIEGVKEYVFKSIEQIWKSVRKYKVCLLEVTVVLSKNYSCNHTTK